MNGRVVRRSVLPGFGLTLGYTLIYVSLLVLIPLFFLFGKAATIGWSGFVATIFSERVLAAYWLSFSAAFVAALVNCVFGFIVAWVLTRYEFPLKKLVDGLIDLPFALPTAVAGIALTTIYSQNGWIGQYAEALGIKIAFTPLGIVFALIFIGLPFVVRTVQPVLLEADRQMEEAAHTLGASRWVTFRRVIFPNVLPALMTGFTLAFARAIGEYGSVVFISGNMPMKTEIAPLLIMTKLEQFDYAGATAIAAVMLVISFVMLLVINVLQWKSGKRHLVG
ncbi:sulfate ABC transporter permease subunit CysT [Brevibacillus fluminis]|uniref:Sulfate transport system permease protein CysT n=1 Tax=Brevibacillus fluminis TaxID=511487 RepID=A0A3M8DBJ0_9BACL|nr:sulfate ABC transporter permease subunit CysT [Brevibacillus fluminis]RNB85402.1 sulfate ABC transporter permease subunit CysT [Brevibacillus fluminis]